RKWSDFERRPSKPRLLCRQAAEAESGEAGVTAKAQEKDNNVAGEVLTAKQAPHGPAPPRRSVCAPGRSPSQFMRQTAASKETPVMTWFSFTNWLKRAKRHATAVPHTTGRNNRSQKLRFRPWLEDLECRNLPSTLMVLTNADSGTGSLRDTIAAANRGDTIVFDSSLDGQTITLTS